MKTLGVAPFVRKSACSAALVLGAMIVVPEMAQADEGGVGFWLPGLFGSLAAAPQVPGWSLGMIYIHDSVSASSNVATARAITIGQFNPTLTERLNASLRATSDIGVISPTYVCDAGLGRPGCRESGCDLWQQRRRYQRNTFRHAGSHPVLPGL